MVHALCQSCLQPYRLMISPEEVPLIRQISENGGHTAPCPRQCGGSINLVGDPAIDALTENARLKDPMTITGTELYRAVNGSGLPDELPKNVETIEAMLVAHKVEGVVIEAAVDGRMYLHELHLANGTAIHLTSGLKGAEVLKITRRGANAG